MTRLYQVLTTNIPEYHGHTDVTFRWLCIDRKTPIGPYETLIEGYAFASDDNNKFLSRECADELFTEVEAQLLMGYLDDLPGEHNMEAVELPLQFGLMPFSGTPFGGGIDLYMLNTHEDYSLPFTVMGYFDLWKHPGEHNPWLSFEEPDRSAMH